MPGSRPSHPIAERVDEALRAASESKRVPVELVLGMEDYPAFEAWAREAGLSDIEHEGYQGVRVRRNEGVFLSRLKLKSELGLPNALLL